MRYLLLVLGVILGLNGVVFAVPSLNGSTGLIGIPSAQALEFKQYNLGIDYLYLREFTADANGAVTRGSSYDDVNNLYKFNLGIFKNWEMGIVGGSTPTEGVFMNVKYFLMSDTSRFPMAIAVGARNISSDDDTDAYMVMSKRFPGGLDIHLGFRAEFNDDIDASVMFGGEYFLNDKLSVLGDTSGEEQEYIWNGGLRFYYNADVVFNVSVTDIGEERPEGIVYTMGVSFASFME